MDLPFCANGCGFFGSPENQNMCSKCYRDHAFKLLAEKLYFSANQHRNDESLMIDMSFGPSASKSDEPKEKKRCKNCNKKVVVTGGFMCRCGDLFCGKHRYPEEHSCTVDYKQIGRQLIQKQNPLCKADKLSRII